MRVWTGGLWVALASILVGCASSPRPAASEGTRGEAPLSAAPKRITAAVLGDVNTLHSKTNLMAGAVAGLDAIEDLVNAGTAVRDRQVQLVPQLAQALPSIDTGSWRVLGDGTTETVWTLHPGAQWHDGTPFTADDLALTAAVLQDPELPTFRHAGARFVDSFEAVDARTFRIRWNAPFIGADSWFTREAGSPLPAHLLKAAYADNKAGLLDLPYWTDEFVGTGPFRVREFARGSHLLLYANDRYVLGRPKLDTVEIRIIPDAGTIAANLLAGSVELTLGRVFALEQALPVRDQWRDGTMEVAPYVLLRIAGKFNSPSPPIVANPQFRRALLHAIDREQMVETLQGGMATVAHGILPNEKQFESVQADVVRYQYDPRRAAQMIQELGFTKGSDGFFRPDSSGRPDGPGREPEAQKLTVELRTNAGNANQEKAFLATIDFWQRVGVGVEPLLVPAQRGLDREYRANRPAFLLGAGNSGLELVSSSLHSSRIPTAQTNYVGTNDAQYASPELDALVDRYLVTIPTPDRRVLLRQIVHHIAEHLPMLTSTTLSSLR